jgi:hypothetical protein
LRSDYLKREITLSQLFMAVAIMITAVMACKKQPVCERDNTGFTKIYNNTGVTIKVKIYSATYPGDGFLAERSVDIGQTTAYDNVPSGPIEIWEDDVNSPWGYWATVQVVCDTLKFNIYPYGK